MIGLGFSGIVPLASIPASAQVAPPPTREEVVPPAPDQPVDRAPRLTIEGDVPRGACSLDAPEFRTIRLTLRGVEFDGLKGLSADALDPAFADLLGQEMPVAGICGIRDRAAAILNAAGYLAVVEVPEQRIENGTVRLRVVMARLVGIHVQGDDGAGGRRVARLLERLTRHDVFNRFEAERILLLAGDLPGHHVRLALRPAGTVRGEVIGEVFVRRQTVAADFSLQNLGSREVGPWGLLARAQFFGLTGLGDRTSVALFTTAEFDEQQTVQAAHDFAIGGDGLRLGGQFTYSWAHPDLGTPAIDIRSRTMLASVEASYPFVRRRDATLRGTLGFDVVDQDVDFSGIGLSRDHLRVPFLRLAFDATDLGADDPRLADGAQWRFGATLEARHGIGGLGASRGCGPGLVNCFAPGLVPPSRLEGDPSALVLRGGMEGEVRAGALFGFAVAARGQYSDRPLFSFEEFSAGNYTVGRGYDPGALQGDSGVGLRAELRVGRAVPRSPTDIALEAFGFVDQAWTWNRDRLFVVPDAELTSAGGGLRIAWGDRVRIEATVAVPLDRLPLQARRGDARALLTLTTRLLPWSFR